MLKKVLFPIVGFILLCIIILLGINASIIAKSSNNIVDVNVSNDLTADCILVLGASVYSNDTPSPMLKDRLDMGIHLYNNSYVKKILVSGDHINNDYDEVNAMKKYLIDNNIPSSDVFKDHEGINTYQSLYRAKNVYGVKRVIIVTQKYHLYRAIYIARKLDLQVVGIASDGNYYKGQFNREIREFFARIKAFFNTSIQKENNHDGLQYDIKGNGDITN